MSSRFLSPMTFFARSLPDIETLRSQRFALMHHGKRTFHEWADMTPYQRDDFLIRLMADQEKQQIIHDKMIEDVKNRTK